MNWFILQSPLFTGFVWESIFSSLNKRMSHGLSTNGFLLTKKEVILNMKREWPSFLFYFDLTIKSVRASCISVIQPSYKLIWAGQKSRERWLQESIWIVQSRYCNIEDDGNLRALPELPCFRVVWPSCIACILVFKTTNTNPPTLYDQKHRGTSSSLVSCRASRYHVLNVPTQHLKAEISLFCLWFKLAGWEPAPIWKQCNFSVQCSARLKLTQLCCVYKSYFFFPVGLLDSLEIVRHKPFCKRWHSSALCHICLLFLWQAMNWGSWLET